MTSLVIGMALGLLGATAKLSNIWLLRKIATVYTATMRGIPELLLVLFIYYGGSILLMTILKKFGYNDYVEISAFWGGVMALSIAFGAYATEIFRMSIQEIPIGQREAAQAIGMRPFQTFYRCHLAASLANRLTRIGQSIFGFAERYRFGIGGWSQRHYVSVVACGTVHAAAIYLLYGSGDYLFGSDHVDYRLYDVA